MKNAFFTVIFTAILSLFLFGCTNSSPTVSEKPIENSNSTQIQNQSETVAAHTLDKEKDRNALPKNNSETDDSATRSDGKTKWTRSGDPIDTTKFDVEIEKAEKDLKAKPNDETAKKNLSEAYTKRGVALTDARQYASAIGDYRRALKYDPNNEESKKWIATITNIYNSINREVPKEGEEPEPLEFQKKTS